MEASGPQLQDLAPLLGQGQPSTGFLQLTWLPSPLEFFVKHVLLRRWQQTPGTGRAGRTGRGKAAFLSPTPGCRHELCDAHQLLQLSVPWLSHL